MRTATGSPFSVYQSFYLSEAVPGSTSFALTRNMPGIGEGAQVVLNRVAVCASQLRSLCDGNAPVLTHQFQELDREFRQIAQYQALTLDP